jgi:hypothetical protein
MCLAVGQLHVVLLNKIEEELHDNNIMSDKCLASRQHFVEDDRKLAVGQLQMVLLSNLEEELGDNNMMSYGCLASLQHSVKDDTCLAVR